MQITTDQKLLRLIKTAPLLVIVIFIVLVATLVVHDNRAKARSDIATLQKDFLARQKALIRSQVDQVYQQIQYAKSNTESTLKDSIRDRVHEAWDIADNIYQNNRDKSEQEVTRLIADALRPIRFNQGRGYFFIYKSNGLNVMHPLLPQMEGTSRWDLQDIKGNYIVREMGERVKTRGEAYYRWWFVKPKDKNRQFEKIGFGKYFAPYDWFIGTGEYLIDVENDIKQRLLAQIGDIRYGDNGYIFIVDNKGTYLADYRPEQIGSNRLTEKDSNGKPFVREIIRTAQRGQDFLQYVSPYMPTTGAPAEKISYVRGLPDWNWAIGSGTYISEIEDYLEKRKAGIREHNRSELLKILLLGLAVTAALAFILLIISKNLSRRFEKFQRRIVSDFEELEKTRDQLQHMALHDALTDLPNRVLLKERILQGMELSGRNALQLAVMFVDLDDFKKINDLYGHSVGDSLLKSVSEAFATIVRPGDSVSRFGGDEFIFCFPELSDLGAAEHKVEQIRQVFRQEFLIDGKRIFSSCSIGVAMYPGDGDDPEQLISNADIVLYKSKLRQKGNFLFFDKSINQQVQHDFLVEAELRQALAGEEFNVLYQPQIDIGSGDICGVEALLRWHNRALGSVSPVEFIGIAEDIGLIQELGMFVVRKSCRDILEFNRDSERSLRLSINISPRQLTEPGFIDSFIATVEQTGMDIQLITLEITENVLIGDLDKVAPILQQLRDVGCGISVDDFGTGYSSLSYLSTLPINEIKIDRSFVDKLLTSTQSESLVRAIVAIGESCQMTVVAEGVETAAQLARLSQYQCDLAQGYYFDRPLAITALFQQYQGSRVTDDGNATG